MLNNFLKNGIFLVTSSTNSIAYPIVVTFVLSVFLSTQPTHSSCNMEVEASPAISTPVVGTKGDEDMPYLVPNNASDTQQAQPEEVTGVMKQMCDELKQAHREQFAYTNSIGARILTKDGGTLFLALPPNKQKMEEDQRLRERVLEIRRWITEAGGDWERLMRTLQ